MGFFEPSCGVSMVSSNREVSDIFMNAIEEITVTWLQNLVVRRLIYK